MRKIPKTLMTALGAFAFVAATAGTSSAATVEVKVPFSFLVNGTSFPAGEYVISRGGTGSSVLVIRDTDGTGSALIHTIPVSRRDATRAMPPAVTFEKYENTYRLTTIWNWGRDGRELMPMASAG